MPNEDMPQFYAGAQAFLFPTLYEGFGLPPVEAMACGAPVISSDAPAMPEVLGDAAILESLTNVERFADAIRSVLVNEKLRETLRDKGIRRAATFRYEHSAKQFLEIFEQLVPTGTNAR
jgi:glycosyltransferase involved in cell wall biosynthesis